MIPINTIDLLLLGKSLSAKASEDLFQFFLDRRANTDFQKQTLILLHKKGEQSDELVGLVRAVQKAERRIPFENAAYLVDGCGTGGDGTGTINVSTIASIVAAGAGAYVAKHGNRSVSSRCGSADLLEALGVKIDAPRKNMLKAIHNCGLGYFHAPFYHPLFKALQPVRSSLGKKGVRTIFNFAGPFVNPLRPRRQVIGVFSRGLVEMFAHTAKKLGYEHALIVWGDGMDELTTTRKSFSIEVVGRKMRRNVIDSQKLGLPRGKRAALRGGTIAENQRIARAILEGKDKSARRDVVLLNAAALLYVSGRVQNLHDGIRLAQQSIRTKKAQSALAQLVQISHASK